MDVITIDADMLHKVVGVLSQSEMMANLGEDLITQIVKPSQLLKFGPDEFLIKEGDPSEFFFMLIEGEVAVLQNTEKDGEQIELAHLKPPSSIGEIGLMLERERTASIRTVTQCLVLKIERVMFNYIFENFPKVGIAICKSLAHRVQALSVKISLPQHDDAVGKPPADVMKMLPMEVIIRHRILPLKMEKNVLHLGSVGDPTPTVIGILRRLLPSMKVRLLRIKPELFEEVLQSSAGIKEWDKEEAPKPVEEPEEASPGSPKLDALLKRIIGEGASDLHLPAGQTPHWRIDGEIKPIADAKTVGPEEVLDLLKPVMNQRAINDLETRKDADFAYSIPGTGRFRVNLYRDDNGFSAAIRVIPYTIFSFDQLGTPPAAIEFCRASSGLILVTGPSGSGKSTTLAAMINHINSTRNAHIITLEDPVEFIYKSDKSLINQREIGNSAESFARGLRAALREDPDIVLVGELRDQETIALAIETANTGHLVLATLHTTTSLGTINRIIDAFPPELQKQVRSDLGQCLKGIICQRLLKRIDGGRIAAFEMLVMNKSLGNMIREDKIIQIPNMMQTGKKEGNVFMNESMMRLVKGRKVELEEAMKQTTDKADLKQRMTFEDSLTMVESK